MTPSILSYVCTALLVIGIVGGLYLHEKARHKAIALEFRQAQKRLRAGGYGQATLLDQISQILQDRSDDKLLLAQLTTNEAQLRGRNATLQENLKACMFAIQDLEVRTSTQDSGASSQLPIVKTIRGVVVGIRPDPTRPGPGKYLVYIVREYLGDGSFDGYIPTKEAIDFFCYPTGSTALLRIKQQVSAQQTSQ